MGDNFKGLLSRDYQMFCYTSLKIDFERTNHLKKHFDELYSSFREKASNQLSRFEKLRKSRANIGLRFRSKHKRHRYM